MFKYFFALIISCVLLTGCVNPPVLITDVDELYKNNQNQHYQFLEGLWVAENEENIYTINIKKRIYNKDKDKYIFYGSLFISENKNKKPYPFTFSIKKINEDYFIFILPDLKEIIKKSGYSQEISGLLLPSSLIFKIEKYKGKNDALILQPISFFIDGKSLQTIDKNMKNLNDEHTLYGKLDEFTGFIKNNKYKLVHDKILFSKALQLKK